MKVAAKLVVVSAFSLAILGLLLSGHRVADVLASVQPTPTPAVANKPPANTPVANTASANAAPANAVPSMPAAGGKEIPKTFTLSADSQDEHGEVAFNHDNHAFKNYSPDGKSVMGCVECHHTDQPKSALKSPLVTSERDVPLTLAVFQKSEQKVSNCRTCHFQDGNVPDGKEMPQATYTSGGTSTTKELNNKIAYHVNCNTCHDQAAALRPELKSKAGFATGQDCMTCHKKN
jgi:hypothetical protein